MRFKIEHKKPFSTHSFRFSSSYLISLLALLLFISSFSACRPPRKGALSTEAMSELEQIANSNVDTETKYHRLAARISEMLDEALAKDDDQAMLSHMQEFYELHDDALRLIGGEIDFWFKHMDDEEKNEFLMRLWPTPYAKNLRENAARFRRRTQSRDDYQVYLDRILRSIEMRK